MSSQRNIKKLVKRLKDTLDEIDWMGRKIRPVLRDPATKEELEALAERDFNGSLPQSYRQFLELANGMEGGDQYDWIIKGATKVEKGESFADVRAGHIYSYKQKDEEHPVVIDLEKKGAPIAGTDFDYQVVYFVPETLDQKEPGLRRVGLDASFDHYPLFQDFSQFLEFVVLTYEDLLEFQNETDPEAALGDEEQLLRELATLLADHEKEKKKKKKAASAAPIVRKKSDKEEASKKVTGAQAAGEEAALEVLEGGGAGEGDLDLGFLVQPEPEPEPELSPEMKKAAKLCNIALQKLMDAELVEIVEAPMVRENLEDYMLKKLVRSSSPQETMEKWIYALSKAREVEELYGTDEQLMEVMKEAFEEIG